MSGYSDPKDAIPLSSLDRKPTSYEAMDSPSGNGEGGMTRRRLKVITVVSVLIALCCLATAVAVLVKYQAVINNGAERSCIAGFVLTQDGNSSKDVDDCLSAPCENGGTCVDHVGGFSCVCPTLYVGSHCHQALDLSAVSPCHNSGNCQHSCDVVDNVAVCSCIAGFVLGQDGISCEDVDDCLSAPCENGGTCVDHVGGFSCVCPSLYVGSHCHQALDLSAVSPCHNNGDCQHSCDVVDNVAVCSCIAGFVLGQDGLSCEDVDDCLSAPCENGGTCVDHVSGFSCVCPSLYIGSHCHQGIDLAAIYPCYNNGPCAHMCSVTRDGAVCFCMDGFVLGEDGTSCRDESIIEFCRPRSGSVTGTSGTVVTPPSGYGEGEECQLTFIGPVGTIIVLEVTVEDFTGPGDLSVRDTVGTFGITTETSLKRHLFYSDSGVISMSFHGHPHLVTTFNLTYAVRAAPEQSWPLVDICSSDRNGLFGRLTSPNFPQPYNDDTNCSISITQPPGLSTPYTVQVVSRTMSTEMCCDVLNIAGILYRGQAPINETYEVEGHGLNMRFTSDHSVVGFGFDLVWCIRSY